MIRKWGRRKDKNKGRAKIKSQVETFTKKALDLDLYLLKLNLTSKITLGKNVVLSRKVPRPQNLILI